MLFTWEDPMKLTILGMISLVFLSSTVGWAKIHTETVTYKDGDLVLEGHLAWDDSFTGKRPGVLVVHEWWGLNDYAKWRADELAKLGYVAFALDMYGKGKTTAHPEEAGTWAGALQKNVPQWQTRAKAGLTVLNDHTLVDSNRVAAIGYCFGGATVMALAYSGVDVKGVVSFHGSLPIPTQGQATQTRAKIFIAHGNADPFLKRSHMMTFQKTLDEYQLDWQMVIYSGARHSFTNPNANQFGIDGIQYNRNADHRSWLHMQQFFHEIFLSCRIVEEGEGHVQEMRSWTKLPETLDKDKTIFVEGFRFQKKKN